MSGRARACVAAMIFGAAGLFSALELGRWRTFHNDTFDLAFYARMAWGMSRGELMDPIVGAHFLGLHISPVLLPLGLAGRVFGYVPVLLLAQSFAVASAAWPLARMAERRFGTAGAVAGALAWLLYPNIGHVASYEFHPGTCAVLPLAWAMNALDRRDGRVLVWATLGTLACREDLAAVTAMIGVLAVLAGGPLRARGLAVATGSMGYLLVYALLIHPRYAPEVGSLEGHFGQWGSSASGVLFYVLSHPAAVVSHLSAVERLRYLPAILAPLAFLPLVRPAWLLAALPVLAVNLLSSFPGTVSLDSHYLTPAVPVLLAAAITGAGTLWQLRRLAALGPVAGSAISLIAPALAAHIYAGGTPLAIGFDSAPFMSDDRTHAAGRVVAAVPSQAPVQAPDALLAHLAARRHVYRAPPPERVTRFVVLDVWQRLSYAHNEDLLRTTEEPVTRAWLDRPDHALVVAEDKYLLLERGRHPRSGLGGRAIVGRADPGTGQAICACLAVIEARLSRGTLVLDVVARSECPGDLAIRLGTGRKPRRVDLLFGGLLSPVHLRRGDRARTVHELSAAEEEAIARQGLRVGALRSSGARPDPGDPTAVTVQVVRQ